MVPSAANRIQSPNPTTAFAKLCPRVDELRGEMAFGSRLSKLLQYVICFTKLGILLIIHASCSANTTLYHATPQLCKIVEKVCYKEVFFLLFYTLYYIIFTTSGILLSKPTQCSKLHVHLPQEYINELLAVMQSFRGPTHFSVWLCRV